ncbi:hypothetical protein SUGI_0667170 [Cryptomeria japonica]|nr:hypothetical protein SUGI_0667170 [Cryptomeria japonica]
MLNFSFLPTAYEKLVERFVEFCGGLPLSLKVLGAHLYGRNENYWELEYEKIKNIQPKDVMQSLKISFDSLDSQEKHIFIDIGCFFNKNMKYLEKNVAISIWKASGWSAELAVQTLQDKCLLEITDDDEFEMLNVRSMESLKEMDLDKLQRLNTLEVYKCPKLETISSLSSAAGLEVRYKRLCSLERIDIRECRQLQSIEGLEELQALKCLVFQVPEYGDPSVWNCISGLRRLPSEYAVLMGKAVPKAKRNLNADLFSGVIDAQAVAELRRGDDKLIECNHYICFYCNT